MNILINYLGKSNSGPIIALEMAKGFANNGHSVSAILCNKIENKNEWLKYKDIIKLCFIDTYSNKVEFVFNTLLFQINKKKILGRYFSETEFDVVINPMHHLWSSYICSFFDSRIISVCHDPVAHEGENCFETKMTERLMGMSDDIIVMSKKFIPIIKNKYGLEDDNIFYMKHGLLSNYKNNLAGYSSIYDENNWNFLFFGRIEKYKGVDVLLKAFDLLSNEIKNVNLYIVGKGQIEDIKVSDDKRIKIINKYIPDEEVGRYFNSKSVVVVLPYINASQSGIVAIALDFNNLIISSDVGGLKEQLDDGNIGVFSKPNDVKSLYESMKRIISDDFLRKQQIEKISTYKETLSWDSIMNKLSDELFNS